jgi:hypothetical protein
MAVFWAEYRHLLSLEMARNGGILGGLGQGVNELFHAREVRCFHENIFSSYGIGKVLEGLKMRVF